MLTAGESAWSKPNRTGKPLHRDRRTGLVVGGRIVGALSRSCVIFRSCATPDPTAYITKARGLPRSTSCVRFAAR